MLNVEQLKYSVNRMPVERVADAVLELRLEGLVTDDRTPFGKVHFNTCFAEIEALFQRAGYHRGWMWWVTRVALCPLRPRPLGAGAGAALAEGAQRGMARLVEGAGLGIMRGRERFEPCHDHAFRPRPPASQHGVPAPG
jgi:hypothetical protein